MANRFDRVILVVLDSVGIGAMPDAADFGGADATRASTLANTARAVDGLFLPNLGRLGIGNLTPIEGTPPAAPPMAIVARAALAAPNKDTTSGHWEMMSAILENRLNTYPDGFPADLIELFKQEAEVDGVLANKVASGTEVIMEYGDEHVRTGWPIVYTSADSVFQVAAHEEAFGLERLYKVCAAARRILRGKYEVGRVIARPFLGASSSYQRTANRHDYSLEPPVPTVLDRLVEKRIPVLGIGKIQDIFAGKGVPENWKSVSNLEGVEKTLQAMAERPTGLVFTNLVDFDMLFGHRNDAPGYARSLEEFDALLPGIESRLKPGDLLIITADHGNDPTTPSTDHDREYCPIIARHPGLERGKHLADRRSLADIGATVAEIFGVPAAAGESFLAELE